VSEGDRLRSVLGFLVALLGRRDWVYLLSLLVPFVAYNLALKASSVASRFGGLRLARTLKLMRSDVFFNLGYASLWLGLFAIARRGPLRWAVVVLFHVATMLVALFRTSAHRYYGETGTTLDYGIVALWLPRFDEIKPMIQLPPPARILLAAAIFYATSGPFLVTRAVGRLRGLSGSPPTAQKIPFLVPLGLCLQALGCVLLSLPSSPNPAGKAFARDPFVNLIFTGIKGVISGRNTNDGPAVKHPAANASLAPTPRTKRHNVVLVHLESTRAGATTPYGGPKTTPFLDELAKQSSLLVERAYTTVPHTAKASVSVNCGVYPPLRPTAEAEPDSLPARGIADLLREQGYSTVLFQSSTENFDDFGRLAKNLGYEDHYPLEAVDKEGFERSNYFGYEDDIMLKPSERWLREHKSEPFVVEYLTGTAHHDYQPPSRYGHEDFAEDDKLDRYLNCVRYQDFFLRNLINQYKELGLYDNTIFVVFGDHGEGFGEHDRYGHEDVPYEEGLKIPLIIHAPGLFEDGERSTGPSNLTDVLPTVLDLLGYEVKGGEYPGYSLLRPLPKDRPLMFSCFNKNKGLASIKGFEKYIYHYGDLPDELFDLSEDPLERKNLADERAREVGERRDELLAWRSSVER
jgi:lipoteichoic acid synthase